jgi:hypothetical protein
VSLFVTPPKGDCHEFGQYIPFAKSKTEMVDESMNKQEFTPTVANFNATFQQQQLLYGSTRAGGGRRADSLQQPLVITPRRSFEDEKRVRFDLSSVCDCVQQYMTPVHPCGCTIKVSIISIYDIHVIYHRDCP